MPRNGSSVYSLPAGNPVIPGTVIATTWANTTLTDIATALTNSLSTDGSTASVSLSGKTMAGGTFSGPTVTGILTLTGGQIAFPAVQIPSANVNTLDDYEEGTWTPTVTFATPGNLNVVYSTRTGTYTKIGRAVIISYSIATSTWTHSTASGTLTITGLPFTVGIQSSGIGHTFLFCNTGGAANFPTAQAAATTSTIVYGVTNLTSGLSGIYAPAAAPSGQVPVFAGSTTFEV